MYKKSFKKLMVYGIVFLLLLTSCHAKSEREIPASSLATSPAIPSISQASPAVSYTPASSYIAGQYMFYTDENGLYRTNLDGSGKMMLESSKYLRLVGNIIQWIYFTDKDNKLYKIDENGQQKKMLLSSPVFDAIVIKDTVYYIQSKNIFSIDTSDAVKQFMEIPEDILQLPYNLKSDGADLYVCNYLEKGICTIYKCDLQNGRFTPKLENVLYDPFVIYEGTAIQVNDSGQNSQIIKQNIGTGQKEKIVDFTGLLCDMGVYHDWLIYITLPDSENQKYINGFNMSSGKAFQLKSDGDYIYQILPSQILLMNSDNKSISSLVIDGDKAYFEIFNDVMNAL